MKFLTTNFVQCAVKSCSKSADCFPLKYSDVVLQRQEVDFDPVYITNLLPKLDWPALVSTAKELGNTSLPNDKPLIVEDEENEQLLRDLHGLLLEVS